MKGQDETPAQSDAMERLLERAAQPESEAVADGPDAPAAEPSASAPSGDEKTREAFRQLTDLDEEENDEERRMTFRTIMGGDVLGSHWFRRQMGYVLLLVVLAVLYVSNRYACQREEIRREDLADSLVDRKFKYLTISSELTEFSMRSNVEDNVSDTTLRTSVESSYYLPN